MKEQRVKVFSAKNYLVFYRLDEQAETVYVESVIYSRRNVDELL